MNGSAFLLQLLVGILGYVALVFSATRSPGGKLVLRVIVATISAIGTLSIGFCFLFMFRMSGAGAGTPAPTASELILLLFLLAALASFVFCFASCFRFMSARTMRVGGFLVHLVFVPVSLVVAILWFYASDSRGGYIILGRYSLLCLAFSLLWFRMYETRHEVLNTY